MRVATRSNRQQRAHSKQLVGDLFFFLAMLLAILCGIYLAIWFTEREREEENTTAPRITHCIHLHIYHAARALAQRNGREAPNQSPSEGLAKSVF
jgi:hypothetical protein